MNVLMASGPVVAAVIVFALFAPNLDRRDVRWLAGLMLAWLVVTYVLGLGGWWLFGRDTEQCAIVQAGQTRAC